MEFRVLGLGFGVQNVASTCRVTWRFWVDTDMEG